jgi:hypothetical protein
MFSSADVLCALQARNWVALWSRTFWICEYFYILNIYNKVYLLYSVYCITLLQKYLIHKKWDLLQRDIFTAYTGYHLPVYYIYNSISNAIQG